MRTIFHLRHEQMNVRFQRVQTRDFLIKSGTNKIERFQQGGVGLKHALLGIFVHDSANVLGEMFLVECLPFHNGFNALR